MEFVHRLFKYDYKYYVQGTEERATEYALMTVPKDTTFNNNRSTLFQKRNKPGEHEVDLESVVDLTIKW